MKQYEQVIEVMNKNGGYATLGFLNHNIDVSDWPTKTPFASIRRIVQDKRFFFKIKPGLWALHEFKKQVLSQFQIENANDNIKNESFNHSYYQGLLIEIGNLKGFDTFVPNQDKNKSFLNKPLKNIATIENIYEFSYPQIINRAKTIDVIWFNNRNLPNAFFEVEHSTDIQNSLLKYNDLQDFNSKFYIVSSEHRENEFNKKISYQAFEQIKNRVDFLDYDFVSKFHSKSFELSKIGSL